MEEKIKETLNNNFVKTVKGYHIISKEPLKEARWEEVNCEIFLNSDFKINKSASGSHCSGCDIDSAFGKLSNKTAKINKNSISVSSYRLTSTCDKKNVGDIGEIIKSINKKNSSFEYYSLLVRDELKSGISYSWYLIPEKEKMFHPETYTWTPQTNKHNKQSGWKTNNIDGCNMKISFSMSSQLWITVNTETIDKYKIGTTKILFDDKTNMKFSDLVDMMEKMSLKK